MAGGHDRLQTRPKLRAAAMAMALDGGTLDPCPPGPAIDRSPRGGSPWSTVLDATLVADPLEHRRENLPVAHPVREADAVAGRHGGDAAGHCRDRLTQELRRVHPASVPDELRAGEFARSVASAGFRQPADRSLADGSTICCSRWAQGELALLGVGLGDFDKGAAAPNLAHSPALAAA